MKISLNIIRDTTRHTYSKAVSLCSGPRIARPVERLANLQVSLSDPRTRSNIDSNNSGTSQNANRRSNFLYPMEKSSTFCRLRKKISSTSDEEGEDASYLQRKSLRQFCNTKIFLFCCKSL